MFQRFHECSPRTVYFCLCIPYGTFFNNCVWLRGMSPPILMVKRFFLSEYTTSEGGQTCLIISHHLPLHKGISFIRQFSMIAYSNASLLVVGSHCANGWLTSFPFTMGIGCWMLVVGQEIFS